MQRLLLILLLILPFGSLYAQELNCTVQIIAPNLKVVDPKIFTTLEKSIYEFMNNTKWTNEKYNVEERIECDLVITITEELASDRFKAQANILSRRPVYGSDYETILLNWLDKDWEFEYAEYQALEFNANQNVYNLTSMLAYYAYIIIGLDNDSYARNSGTPYFLKAQNIVQLAQNSPETGWKPYDGNRNRHWLVDNLLNPRFARFREAFYKYHRQGLDQFYDDQLTPITVVTQCLKDLNTVNSTNPNSMIIQLFFNAKSDEIIGLYTKAPPKDKTQAVSYLNRLDAANATKYRQILSSK